MASTFGRRELRLVLAVVLGTLLVGGGILLDARLTAVIDERVRVGADTTGRVVHVERLKISRSFAATRLTVVYAFDEVRHGMPCSLWLSRATAIPALVSPPDSRSVLHRLAVRAGSDRRHPFRDAYRSIRDPGDRRSSRSVLIVPRRLPHNLARHRRRHKSRSNSRCQLAGRGKI